MSEPGPAGGTGSTPVDAVVVAAGASRRMAGTDKLLVHIGDRPLVGWSIAAVAAAPSVRSIVVVVGDERLDHYRAAPWLPAKVRGVVGGGVRRQESVAAGVRALDELAEAGDPVDRVVLVHDGARPTVSPALVEAVAAAARVAGAAIPVVDLPDTIKRREGDRIVETVDRSVLASAQTPQGVRRDLLERAWSSYPPEGERTFTDEASLLEACKIPVHAIPGEPGNLKVTLPADLERASAALAPIDRRHGLGSDWHPFGPGDPLRLAGIEIDKAPRLHGHSDGDVALHAVADALLGAAGLGDLGRLFPSDARTPAGIDSADLLAEVVGRLADAGLRPSRVDLTIVAGRPRLGPHLDPMRHRIADLLGLDPGAVNVKASSGNLSGADGAGRGIGAQAMAQVIPR